MTHYPLPITHYPLPFLFPFPFPQMDMAQIFGEYIDNLPVYHEFLIIGFSPNSLPLNQRWRNNALSADFLADYLSTFLPPDNQRNSIYYRPPEELKSAVSYIANELLENAMKFSDENVHRSISIQLHLNAERIIFVASNIINSQASARFKAYIKELVDGNPSELYLHQLEKNAKEEIGSASRLGYLTMIEDYMAKLGWKFETVQNDPEVIVVTTMVQLMV